MSLSCQAASSAASSSRTETLLAGCGDAETREPDRVPTGGGQGYVGLKRSHVGCDKVQDTREDAPTLWVWDQPEMRAIGSNERRWKYVQ
jgi:hypothetical protein